MAQFDDAKVGDRVWDYMNGWADIDQISSENGHPIRVKYSGGGYNWYNFKGERQGCSGSPTLFWSEVKIVAPERPKEHEHSYTIVGQCECGDNILGEALSEALKPKEKCEACELEKECHDNSFGGRVFKLLLSNPQHHTCEKGEK